MNPGFDAPLTVAGRRDWLRRLAAILCLVALPCGAAPEAAPLQALPALDVAAYMGTWYQVAWFPNRFQRQCVADTVATYRLLSDDRIEVVNRCRTADGSIESVTGVAKTDRATIENGQLRPAQLQVTFLPPPLRWLPFWGSYWVIQRADDGRYVVVSEPGRDYLWVLARSPQLAPTDEGEIRMRLRAQGFDLGPWKAHPHSPDATR